jgi:hypothetical protein
VSDPNPEILQIATKNMPYGVGDKTVVVDGEQVVAEGVNKENVASAENMASVEDQRNKDGDGDGSGGGGGGDGVVVGGDGGDGGEGSVQEAS